MKSQTTLEIQEQENLNREMEKLVESTNELMPYATQKPVKDQDKEETFREDSPMETQGERRLSEPSMLLDLNEMVRHQEWSDGSNYIGNFSKNLRMGYGEYTWPQGETYKGEFYKDHQHGKGIFTWPDGNKFTGYYYLSRKEGFGTMRFKDNQIYQGLYRADIRYGPGVESNKDGSQDVGIWYGNHLIRLCTEVPGSLSVSSYPDFCQQSKDVSSITECQILVSEGKQKSRYKTLLQYNHYTLTDGIFAYSTDVDHLPITPSLFKDFDANFYPDQPPGFSSLNTVYTNDINDVHLFVLKHRHRPEFLSWRLDSIMNFSREEFGSSGPREKMAEIYIRLAGEGNYDSVSTILRRDLVHVDVSDKGGFNALHAAAINGHNKIINLLLDNGAGVNKCNDEGLSALSLCMLLYYNEKSFRLNVAERNFVQCEDLKNMEFSSGSNQVLDSQQIYICENEEMVEDRRDTISLLLRRGADPNIGSIPMYALFFAIKAADVSTVQLLLERGAQTDIQLPTKHGTITPLHLAAALPGVEGVRITELLLHAAADPNAKAGDGDYIYEPDRVEIPNTIVGFPLKSPGGFGEILQIFFDKTNVPEEGGRTALHMACVREDNFKEIRDTINLLLNHSANPNVLWSGHSPLSLAVASGNDLVSLIYLN
ncbi:hypothetical protein GDO86_010279 [Hymenochirus boettgeri]|uniref:Ankyrin repeat and MYND domain-containing protein 1 n=1 Tax=Hymenochirus boettgeri TaxID=247094 RepID=A0A8T2JJU0_9PIPI|nr:hypothetical protein GDO86_010279 [Hymenochirus boettgeri]